MTIRSACIRLASSRISRSTLPCSTALEILSGASPVSLATMAIASSAEARCCASKSGGTYSASITGVVGRTLTRRSEPLDSFAIIRAVAMAGLASSTSARSIGTRMRRYMAGPLVKLLIGGGRDQPRRDEALQAPAVQMQARPVVEGKIDDDEARGRQFLRHPLARVDVARRDHSRRDVVQAGIMADDDKTVRAARLADDLEQRLGRGVVDALFVSEPRLLGEGRRHQRPGFLGALGRRNQRQIRVQAMAAHIGADHGGVVAAALGQFAVAVALAGLGPLGFCMAQQDQTAHC